MHHFDFDLYQGIGRHMGGNPENPGVYLYDFAAPSKGAVMMEIVGDVDMEKLSPHGISTWSDPDGSCL